MAKDKDKDKGKKGDGALPPEWLRGLLDAARASSDFERRCEEAGTLARNINRLREANRERAFERVSLSQRVTKLAESEEVPLVPVLAWFGLKELSLADSDEALVRFSRGIGFSPSHFLDHLLIGEAHAQGHPVPIAGRGFRNSLTSLPWHDHTIARFRKLKEVLDAEYRKPEE